MALQPIFSQCHNWTEAPRSRLFKHTTQDDSSRWMISSLQRLYLTTHNTRKRQTSMPPAAFNSTIPASQWPQIHTLEHVTTGIGRQYALTCNEDVKVKRSTHFSSINYICIMIPYIVFWYDRWGSKLQEQELCKFLFWQGPSCCVIANIQYVFYHLKHNICISTHWWNIIYIRATCFGCKIGLMMAVLRPKHVALM